MSNAFSVRRAGAALIAFGILAWPTVAAAQCADGSPPPCRSATRTAAPAANTIAVLYLDNLSRDSSDLYLADGLTEELISRLTQVERLQVKSRTAVRRLRSAATTDPIAAGRALGVAQLLSGSVLRGRGRIRVNVELTRVSTGNSLWARSFDRSADDLIAVEAEIAESIAVVVAGRLAPAERLRIETRHARNSVAYDHLLKGRFQEARGSTDGMLAAVREYETAARLDSTLTAALANVAGLYAGFAGIYFTPELGLSRDSLRKLGRAALERAGRDTTSVEGLMARAYVAASAVVTAPLFARAVSLDPGNPEAHHGYALALRLLGRDSAAASHFQRAIDLDPERGITAINYGQLHLMARRYVEANRWMDSAIAMHPEPAFYFVEHALAKLLIGDTTTARASAELAGSHGSVNGREELLAMIQARAGDSVGARARLEPVERALATSDCYVSHECLELGVALATAGARSRALDLLERMKPRGSWLAYWITRPEFDSVRNDPRYQRVLAESQQEVRQARALKP